MDALDRPLRRRRGSLPARARDVRARRHRRLNAPRQTLLFDAECGFCRAVLGAILMRDRERRIRPVALQDALAADLLPGMSEEDRFASFHLVDDRNTVHSGGDALSLLFERLPRTRRLGSVMRRAQPLTDAVYLAISANRSRIGPLVPASWTRRADHTIRRRSEPTPGPAVSDPGV